MNKTIKERSKEAVKREYNCDFPCAYFDSCIFGSGTNGPYDCEECGAGDYRNGYYEGAKEQHEIDIEYIKDRLTEMHGEYITLELINELVNELK